MTMTFAWERLHHWLKADEQRGFKVVYARGHYVVKLFDRRRSLKSPEWALLASALCDTIRLWEES